MSKYLIIHEKSGTQAFDLEGATHCFDPLP